MRTLRKLSPLYYHFVAFLIFSARGPLKVSGFLSSGIFKPQSERTGSHHIKTCNQQYVIPRSKFMREDINGVDRLTRVNSFTGGEIVHDPFIIPELLACGSLYSFGKYLQITEEVNDKRLERETNKRQEMQASQISTGNISSINVPEIPKFQREAKVDIYRDTALRYLGYANEVGEAFRPVVPSLIVTLSYLLAFGYIFADSYSKGSNASFDFNETIENSEKNLNIKNNNPLEWKFPNYFAAIDCLAFQVMASVVFPSSIINRSVHFSAEVLQDLRSLYGNEFDKYFEGIDPFLIDSFFNYLPTAIGLLLIPAICPPLDILTEKILENTLRLNKNRKS